MLVDSSSTMACFIAVGALALSHPVLTAFPTIRMARMPSRPQQSRRSARIIARIKGTPSIESDDIKGPPSQRSENPHGVRSSTVRTPPVTLPSIDGGMPPLIRLGTLARGTLVKRPSATVRSPYVADVSLSRGGTEASASTVMAHAPALDVGGMCVAGSEVYLSERHGEGKTSHSIELVRGAPLGNGADASDRGVLVGAHPHLGELLAEEVLQRGLLREALSLKNGFEVGPVNDYDDAKNLSGSPRKPRASKRKHDASSDEAACNNSPKTKISLRRQVTLGDSRADFQLTITHPVDGISHRVLFEVKNVVCADYEAGTEPEKMGPGHCVVVSSAAANSENEDGYERTALFPWGRTRGQKFEGKTVVSERACKHLRNLQSQISDDVTPVVLFIVNRSDCESARACREKCPVFAEVLEEVVNAGVKALAVRVRWTEEGECFFDGVVPVKV